MEFLSCILIIFYADQDATIYPFHTHSFWLFDTQKEDTRDQTYGSFLKQNSHLSDDDIGTEVGISESFSFELDMQPYRALILKIK